jgi:hypothetical protein
MFWPWLGLKALAWPFMPWLWQGIWLLIGFDGLLFGHTLTLKTTSTFYEQPKQMRRCKVSLNAGLEQVFCVAA